MPLEPGTTLGPHIEGWAGVEPQEAPIRGASVQPGVSGVLALRRTDVPMYEYACHEGNHSMYGILGGQRAEDMAAAARP